MYLENVEVELHAFLISVSGGDERAGLRLWPL
jgi:hypothetical protein